VPLIAGLRLNLKFENFPLVKKTDFFFIFEKKGKNEFEGLTLDYS